MKQPSVLLFVMLSSIGNAQTNDTLTIQYAESKNDSTFYRRIVEYDPKAHI